MKIYLASSWRNPYYPEVLQRLRKEGYEVYDFRHPKAGDNGFSWGDIAEGWLDWTAEEYLKGLDHPLAEHGFAMDMTAMEWADVGVMLMPCGASAHLELGWFAGNPNKRSIIFIKEYDDAEGQRLLRQINHSLHEAPCPACGDLDGCHLNSEHRRMAALRHRDNKSFEPELMYKMADAVETSVEGVLLVLEAMKIDDEDCGDHPDRP